MCKKMNLKRLSAMVLTLTMLISVFGFGQMTAVNANGGGISIFSADFDQEPYPEFVQLSNGDIPHFSVENGVAYIDNVTDQSGNWYFGGFKFIEPMKNSKYEIEFEFNISAYNPNDCGVAYLTDDAHGVVGETANQTGEFKLINVKDNKLSVGGTPINISYANDKWFNYKMTADSSSGGFTVTITEKDNATNTATATGSNFPIKALNTMMFGAACKIHIDNINVTKLVDAPKILSVKYFGQDGKTQSLPGVTAKSVAVTFSDKMNLDSLKSAVSFKGADNVNIANEGTLSEDKMTYTFELSKKLNADAEYTLAISTDAKSIYDAAIASTYILTETASDGAVIFNADFEKRIPEFVQLSNIGKPTYKIENGIAHIVEETYDTNGNKNWTYGGFVFDDAISSGEYEIEFDFNISNYYNNYGVVYLTDEAHGGSSQPGEFRLININNGALSAGNTPINITYANDKWFHYKMVADSGSGTYSVTVNERDNSTNAATASGSGFPTKALDRMMFGTALDMQVDNISVKKVIKSAKVSRVEYLDINGNVMPSLNASVAAIKIFFSDKMAKVTLNNAVTLKDSDDNAVTYTGEQSDDNTAYILRLTDILEADGVYTLSVTASALTQFGLSCEPYEKIIKISDGNTLLNIDYDNETRAIEMWSGTPSVTYPEENGNKYMTINADWKNSGYSFDRVIPKDGGEYNVKFDFMNDNKVSNYFSIAMTQKDCLSGDGEKSTYDVFGLLALKPSGEIEVAGEKFTGLVYKDDTWYSYDLTFNRSTGAYTLAIYEKNNADNKINGSGTFSKTETWGHSMYDNRLYDAIKFYCDHTISVDNILIRQTDNTSPELGDNSLTYITNGGEVSGDLNNISLNTAKIAIDFKDIINIRTAQGKISLKASADNTEVGYTLSQDGTKLILNLNEGLKAETEYKLTISNGIKSLSDSVVTGVKEFTLKTGKKEFSAKLSALKIGETEVLNYSQWKAAEATVKLNVTNTMGEDVTVPLVIAYFAQSGELLDIQSIDVTIADKSEGEQTKAITLKKPEKAVRAKVMCWKSLDSAKPLSKMLDIR